MFHLSVAHSSVLLSSFLVVSGGRTGGRHSDVPEVDVVLSRAFAFLKSEDS